MTGCWVPLIPIKTLDGKVGAIDSKAPIRVGVTDKQGVIAVLGQPMSQPLDFRIDKDSHWRYSQLIHTSIIIFPTPFVHGGPVQSTRFSANLDLKFDGNGILKNYLYYDSDHISGSPAFSPDARHVAFAEYIPGAFGRCAVRLDGVLYAPHDRIDGGAGIHFSPDSKHLVYVATDYDSKYKNSRSLVMLDNQMVSTYENPRFIYLAFSPDTQHLACAVCFDGLWRIYVDNVERGQADDVRGDSLEFLSNNMLQFRSLMKGDNSRDETHVINLREGNGLTVDFVPLGFDGFPSLDTSLKWKT